jgi:hypothetical protein
MHPFQHCVHTYSRTYFLSSACAALVDYVLKRVQKYGHDQIQFNYALARGGMMWEEAPQRMDSGTVLYCKLI